MGRSLEFADVFPISGLALIGQAALPMGVLCLGAGLQWQAVRAVRIVVFGGNATFLKPLIFLAWPLDGTLDDGF